MGSGIRKQYHSAYHFALRFRELRANKPSAHLIHCRDSPCLMSFRITIPRRVHCFGENTVGLAADRSPQLSECSDGGIIGMSSHRWSGSPTFVVPRAGQIDVDAARFDAGNSQAAGNGDERRRRLRVDCSPRVGGCNLSSTSARVPLLSACQSAYTAAMTMLTRHVESVWSIDSTARKAALGARSTSSDMPI